MKEKNNSHLGETAAQKTYLHGKSAVRTADGRQKLKSDISHFMGTSAVKRVVSLILTFCAVMFMTAAPILPGAYPFGIAAVSAVSGASSLVPVLTGALAGSAAIPTVGGVYVLLTIALAVARITASIWLSADKLPEWMRSRRGREKMWKKLDAIERAGPGGKKFHSEMSEKSEKTESDRTDRIQVGERTLSVIRRFAILVGNADGTMLRESVSVRMAFAALTALFAGAWSVVWGGYSFYDLFGAVFGLLVTPVVTYLFYAATDYRMRESHLREPAVYVILAAVTHGLSYLSTGSAVSADGGIIGSGFNFGIAFAFGAAMIFSSQYGIYRGVFASLACGMVLEADFLPLYALGAVVCTLLYRYSRTLSVISAGVCAVIWATYAGGLLGITSVMPPVVFASAVIIPLMRGNLIHLPKNLFGVTDNGKREAVMAEISRDEMSEKVGRMSESLIAVSGILSGLSEKLSRPSKTEMREICELSFAAHCRSCALRHKCHEAIIPKTAPVISAMTDALCKTGVVSAAVVPSQMAASCYNIGRIIDEINYRAGEMLTGRRAGAALAVSADDYMTAGELMRTALSHGMEASTPDNETSKKLKRLLDYNDFRASSVAVYGDRIKYIFVKDVDLTATRMGGDDIRKLFEEIIGQRLTTPEFSIDGATVSMTLHTAYSYACNSGRATLAASSVQRYYCGIRGFGADCADGSGDGGLDMTVECDGSGENETSDCISCTKYSECMEKAPVTVMEEGETDGISDEIKIEVTDDPPKKTKKCGKTEKSAAHGEVSGDVISSFETGGKYYMLISDGMGTGREAALTSGVCATLLRRLLESGAGLDSSLRMLHGIIRSSERECSTTVDIAEIDLVTGEARFIKSGAAPSFILRDGSIFRLQSKTVPIGIIRALDAEMIKFDIQAGDRVVMVSDGAARSYDEVPWLLDMMTSDETVLCGSPRDAAAKIVREAARRGSMDDITAGVINIGSA